MSAGTYPLTTSKVRAYIHDFSSGNYLLDGEEFSDSSIELAMELALSDYNTITPLSNLAPSQFPSKSLLMYGTLGHLYLGKSAHLARNTMSYSDGGLQIPVEERMELYTSLSSSYFAQFKQLGERLKAQLNVEDGWGSVASDYRQLPSW